MRNRRRLLLLLFPAEGTVAAAAQATGSMLQWTARTNRFEWTAAGGPLHWTANENRFEWTAQ